MATGGDVDGSLWIRNFLERIVTRVLKEVDILLSQTAADVTVIVASAKREATILVNQAEADALQLEQSTKAEWYSALKRQLACALDAAPEAGGRAPAKCPRVARAARVRPPHCVRTRGARPAGRVEQRVSAIRQDQIALVAAV